MQNYSNKFAPIKGLFFVFLPTGLLKTMVKWPVLFGLPFMLIPTIITFAFWAGGSPPAYSLFWDDQIMTIVSSKIARNDYGNGTKAGTPYVVVKSQDGQQQPLQSIQHGSKFIESAYLELQNFPENKQVKVLIAPDGSFHDARIKWLHIITYIVTLICPLFYYIGWAVIKS